MTAIQTQDMADDRQRHLAALIEELLRHGLSCRLLGQGSSVLRVTGPESERRVMILATPTSAGWSYLWSGNGMADATDFTAAAHQIAQLIRPSEGPCPACDSAAAPASPASDAPDAPDAPAPLASASSQPHTPA